MRVDDARQRVIDVLAQEEARLLRCACIGTEHVLRLDRAANIIPAREAA